MHHQGHRWQEGSYQSAVGGGPVLSLDDEVMADGPIALWDADIGGAPAVGTAVPDSSGHHLDLATWNNGGPAVGFPHDVASPVPTDSGMAFQFTNASNIWIAGGTSGAAALGLTTALTVEFWMKAEASNLADQTWHDLVVKGHSSSNDSGDMAYGVRIDYVNPNHVLRGGVTLSDGTKKSVLSNPIGAGELYHVVMTFDSAALRLYTEGAQVSALTGLALPVTGNADSTHNFAMAQFGNEANSYAGILAKVAIYDKALVAGRISTHYHAGMGL